MLIKLIVNSIMRNQQLLAQPLKLQLPSDNHFHTQPKTTKYYSNNNTQDPTIKKRLFEQYNQTYQHTSDASHTHQHSSNTSNCQAQPKGNQHLINQLNNNIHTYQYSFKQPEILPSIQYHSFQFSQPFQPQQDPLNSDFESMADVKKGLRVQRLLLSAAQQLSPKPYAITKIDRQITSLYKENRNINLEYRKSKFMEIFVGKKHKDLLAFP